MTAERLHYRYSRGRFRATQLCGGVAAAVISLAALGAADVPWATPTTNRPAAPSIDQEWAGVKFSIDKDEWRDTPRRHRYVHGCFTPSHLCVSLYLPPKELYRGRFVEHMEGGAGGLDKMMTQPGWDWAFNNAFDDLGAYLVETNEGHWPDEGTGLDNARELWIANGQGVRATRKIAEEMYGKAPTRGYITGCSGGGLRSELGLEYNPDLFDGAVSQAGHGGGTTLGWSALSRMGMLIGKEGVKKIIDAADVGGSGNVFDNLDSNQGEALRDFLRLGYPKDAITGLREFWGGSAPVMLGPTGTTSYYNEFWTQPGFEGHDHPELLKPYLIDQEITLDRVMSVRDLRAAGPGATGVGSGRNPDTATYGPSTDGGDILDSKPTAVLKFPDMSRLFLSRITILKGPDAGKAVYLSSVRDDGTVTAFLPLSPWGFNNVKAGDKVRLDNRDYLAFTYQYRHRGEAIGYAEFPELRTAPNHFLPELQSLLTVGGWPVYKQTTDAPVVSPRDRQGILEPNQKLIYISGTADEAMWPASINTHLRLLHNKMGAQTENRMRMWWMEGVPHCSGPLTGPGSTNRVNSQGFVAQGLVDVMRWAEKGVPAPASTSYRLEENALILPATATERKGIQPVVTLKANGGARAEVSAGKAVMLTASAEVPPGTGSLIRVEWDFDGKGTWPVQEKSVSGARGTFSQTFTFDTPGTYFPAIRVASRRDGVSQNAVPVYNIARARVVVN